MVCLRWFYAGGLLWLSNAAGTGSVYYYAHWVQIFKSKYSDFDFNLAERQNIKISSKYQNKISVQNSKISAVSTPNLTAKAAFFRIFRDLPEKNAENASKPEKSQKSFAPNFGKFWKIVKFCHILIFWFYQMRICNWHSLPPSLVHRYNHLRLLVR